MPSGYTSSDLHLYPLPLAYTSRVALISVCIYMSEVLTRSPTSVLRRRAPFTLYYCPLLLALAPTRTAPSEPRTRQLSHLEHGT